MVRRNSFAVMLALVVIAGLALAPSAGAAFSASQISTPTGPAFELWSSADASSIEVAGTTTGAAPGEAVDIDCFSGSEVVPLETALPLAANGSFYSLSVSLEKASGRACVLRAVPAGTVPSDPSPFAGPQLATGLSALLTFLTGPNEHRPFDFELESVGLTAGTFSRSIGDCGSSGFLLNAALERTAKTFECVGRLRRLDDYQEPADSTRSQIQVDGIDVWAAASIDESLGGNPEHFPAISFAASQDPQNGNTTIDDTETFASCTPTVCTPSSVRDSRTIEVSEDGHLVTITDRWSSTDGEPHALDLLPESAQVFGSATAKHGEAIAYRFPGQASYATHQFGEEVAFGDATPGVIYVKVEGAPDGDQSSGRGAIVFDRPASPAEFNFLSETHSAFQLHQTATVPASGSTVFRTAYVQAYTQAEVEGLVSKATSSFAPPSPPPAPPAAGPTPASPSAPLRKPSLRVTKVKRDTATGTALLLVKVNGPGRVFLSGKGIAPARTSSSGSGIVKLRVRAKGATLRRLKRSGKAKVRAKLDFHAAVGGEARAVKGLTLKRARQRG